MAAGPVTSPGSWPVWAHRSAASTCRRQVLRVEVGDEIEFEVVNTGEVVMRGLKMIPADQAWFWSKSWQRGEREASADIASGRVETFEDSESLLDFIGAGEEGDA